MKNIHVLPTDKPSRLWMTKLGNLARCHDIKPIKEELGHNVNIYITSDEKPKLNDWFLDTIDKVVFKVTYEDILTTQLDGLPSNFKKIILTTDQDLIADGVQAIDDTFLEWFVKNPSCEKVDVEKEEYILQHLFKPQEYKFRFKIIIPKEKNCTQDVVDEAMRIVSKDVRQPKCVRDGLVKQEYYCKACGISQDEPFSKCHESHKHCSCEIRLTEEHKQDSVFSQLEVGKEYEQEMFELGEEHKQETLKEAAEKYAQYLTYAETRIESFTEGAKWQAERMYTYDELRQIAYNAYCKGQLIEPTEGKFNLWIQQFKKK